jgi:hypothetical protein
MAWQQVGGSTFISTATFTRPADTTAYAANDAVSNSTAATVAMNFGTQARSNGVHTNSSGLIIGARLYKSTTTVSAATFRLWLFNAAPTSPAADNAAFTWSASDKASRFGYIDFVSPQATDGCDILAAPTLGNLAFNVASGSSLYGLLQATGAYSPGSAEVFNIYLHVLQD